MKNRMQRLIALACVLVPAIVLAQGSAGSGSVGVGSSDVGSAGSGSSDSGSAPTMSSEAPMPPVDAGGLRKTCTDAMNADPTFAAKIVEIADKAAAEKRLQLDLAQHVTAAQAVAKNEKHVIMAYAAMWIVAALFVMFMWMRQQKLRVEIAQLRVDLDAATKDDK